MSTVKDWNEICYKLEKILWELKVKNGWNPKNTRAILKTNSKLEFVLNNKKPVGILFQHREMGLHPDRICIHQLCPNDSPDKNGFYENEHAYYLFEDPKVRVYDLEGNLKFEGVLKPTDEKLILEFAINHFFVIDEFKKAWF